jgi:hypothetical protein
MADQHFGWNSIYDMSYWLGRIEDDTKVSKAVDEVQEYHDAQDKKEWVEWVGKVLMLHLHAQIVMEKADMVRAEQEEVECNDKMRGHSGSRSRWKKRWGWTKRG